MHEENKPIKKKWPRGACVASVGWASDFSSGHHLAVCGFGPRIGLVSCCLLRIFCVGVTLSPSPIVSPFPCLPKINKTFKKKISGCQVSQWVGEREEQVENAGFSHQ